MLCLYLRQYLCKLVNALAGVVCMHVCVYCTKVTPLVAIHWPQVPCLSVARWSNVSHILYPADPYAMHL